MTFIETLAISVRAIMINKTRSLLTMLGVIIGVGAVILLISIGNGLSQYITAQFDQLGANTITILPGDIFDSSGGSFSEDRSIAAFSNNKLKFSDVVEIKRLRQYVLHVAPVQLNTAEIGFRSTKKKTSVIGTTDEYPEVRNLSMIKGVFFSDEKDARRKVVVLGYSVAEELFGNVDPIGKYISVGGQQYIVSGVIDKIGSGFGGPQFDAYVYIPVSTYKMAYNSEVIAQIVIEVKDKDVIDSAIAEIKKLLLKRFKKDEFSVFETKEILKVINQILGVMTIGLGSIAAISLVVGGIGIMNIMLVSVTERTREIGLRKAVGAEPNQILLQFLFESSLLSILGGSIGVLLAYFLSLIIQQFFPAVISASSIVLAFSVSAAIGIIFGVAPARRASKLSPIEALRYE